MDQHDHAGAKRPTAFIELPVELYHHLIPYLEVRDILALRNTCKVFHELTEDHGLWMTIVNRLRITIALPCSRTEFQAMSVPQAARVLFSALKVETSLLVRRESVTCHIHSTVASSSSSYWRRDPECWRALAFISERFLLSVHNGVVNIWDVSLLVSSSAGPPEPWAHFGLAKFIVHAEHDSTLYISVASGQGDQQSVVIYYVPQVERRHKHNGRLHLEAKFPLQKSEQLKYLDPSSGRALLYCIPTHVSIVHWRNGNRRSTISIRPPDGLDGNRHKMSALRLCGPYILCFWLRSVAAYPIPADTATTDPLPEIVHQFHAVRFRRISVSQARRATCPSGEIYTLFLLGYDSSQGLLHYRIQVRTCPVPSISVRTLAKGGLGLANTQPPPTGYAGVGMYLPLPRTSVPTCTLALGGLHGVWVEQERGTAEQKVIAFRTCLSRLRAEANRDIPGMRLEEVPHVEGEVVHIIPSRGSQDIETCAMSDWNGRIALGLRSGDILLL